MADIELLRATMSKSGMTISSIAKNTGMLRETLYNRMENGDFKASEISSLTKVLGLTKRERDLIFFAKDSELNSTKIQDD